MHQFYQSQKPKNIFDEANLDLEFARTKSLNDSVSGKPLITFTRASSATYFDAGGIMRTTPVNLVARSEEIGISPWGLLALSVSADAVASPIGIVNADKIIESATTAEHLLYQTRTGSSETVTFSIYAKAAERTRVRIGFSNFLNEAIGAIYDLSNGTVVLTNSSGTDYTNPIASIIAIGSGWYRCIFTVTKGSVNTSNNLFAEPVIGTNINYLGDGTSGLFVWGAQCEIGGSATAYIRTQATVSGAPRFDHDPVTGESLGLLIEKSATNLLVQSENFGTSWTLFGLSAFGSGSILNNAVAPDNNLTADFVREDASNGQHNLSQTSTTTGVKTFSIFAKQAIGTRLLRMVDYNAIDGAQGETYFNLNNGTVISGTGNIKAIGNGWYRCSIVSTTTVTSTYYVSLASSASVFSYAGDSTSGIYIWGAQLETFGHPTSYIPTTTSQVTRAADTTLISGSDFATWYNSTAGTVFCDSAKQYPVSANDYSVLFDVTNASRSEIWQISYLISSLAGIYVSSAGSIQAELYPTISTLSRKMVFATTLNDFNVMVSGNPSIFTNTSGTMPINLDRCAIGQNTANTQPLNGSIKRLTYWGKRISDVHLLRVTK